MQEWNEYTASQVTPEALHALWDGACAALRIPAFAGRKACAQLARQLRTVALLKPYVGHPVGSGLRKDGPMQCEWSNDRAGYFSAVRRLSLPLCSLIPDVLNALRQVWSAEVQHAHEPDFGGYHAGTAHEMQDIGMHLHVDWAQIDAPSWQISAVNGQLSWVVCLDAAAGGGETVVYERVWQPSDTAYLVRGGYHYVDSVVQNRRFVRLQPIVGDLILFNSRNFHRVERSIGSRLTVGSFIGRYPDGRLIVWS